jgi:hypothetical protein
VRVGLASRKEKEEEGKWRWVGPGLARGLCWAVLPGEGRLVVLAGLWAVRTGSGYGPRGVLGKLEFEF